MTKQNTLEGFSGYPRPDKQEANIVHGRLVEQYGPRQRRPSGERPTSSRDSILDGVVRTILSQNTTDKNSTNAFRSLKKQFSTWEEVRVADRDILIECIRSGGLAPTKSARIQSLLNEVYKAQKECSLEYLRSYSTNQVRQELSKYKGVGPKTIACVLLFTMERPDFAVDTHVYRVSDRLGWIPSAAHRRKHNMAVERTKGINSSEIAQEMTGHPKTTIEYETKWPAVSRETTYAHLNEKIPDDLKYPLHLLLIHHGRAICTARNPGCHACILQDICDYGTKNYNKTHKRERSPSD